MIIAAQHDGQVKNAAGRLEAQAASRRGFCRVRPMQ